ncbi:LysR family transcriptional regulator [Shewanella sp. NIFS-20-20]|uniref:LysR family transcriptional regulator n=1 Tax=Shewanella sp. NIFS-20-20 TaxID=2853806 RepID=UPI001C44929F|nr:LysR family transcriptional regulator [Shewanella sp. NIFS-20-20]MBV7316313.1 LysR family transcriptional regulator [Shewanella sp. NIFS-20-20]
MLDQELRALFVFTSIYETGSARLVSEMYQISQSKVSRYLAVLRDIYADTLFIRKKAGFLPTERAHQLYPLIKQMTQLTDQLIELNRRQVQVHECVIAVPALFSVGLPEYLQRTIALNYPNITIVIKPSRRAICEDVIKGNVCLAITSRDCTRTSDCSKQGVSMVEADYIAQNEVVFLVANEQHPIWETDQTIENIANYPYLVTQTPGFNDLLDPMEACAKELGFPLVVSQRGASLATLAEAIIDGESTALLGARCAAEFMAKFPGIKMAPLSKLEFARLHHVMPAAKYSCICRQDRQDKIPPLLVSAIKDYLAKQICE